MGRPATFSEESILDAAADLIAVDGVGALSVVAVAKRIGAPSGSIYHRFPSRDHLVASLWLRTVDRFQDGWEQAALGPDPLQAARASARFVLRWSREHRRDAQILLLHNSNDLLSEDWPVELRKRNLAQRRRIQTSFAALANRLGATTEAEVRRLRFAIVDIPYGAVREPLSRGRAPHAALDDLVDVAVMALLARPTTEPTGGTP